MRSAHIDRAEQRIRELAENPICREFMVQWLLGAMEERHWPLFVQSVLEYQERIEFVEPGSRLFTLMQERFPDA